MEQATMRTLGIVLLVVGALLIVVAIVYWTVPVGHLPSFMGHAAGSTKHHTKRALGATVVGLICLIGGWVAFARGREAQTTG
jgi:tetrahydromethanopterin S-methyltransferase subunit D